jgi:hypothetical protein
MLMWGHSHGGCITLRAIEAGAPVQAAAVLDAPVDMAKWYNYCDTTVFPGNACFTDEVPLPFFFNGPAPTLALTFSALGPGLLLPLTPSESPIPYNWRSPITFAGDLRARGRYLNTDIKVLVLQGNADPLIEPSQACALSQAEGSFTNFHVQSWGACTQSSDCLSGTCNILSPGVGQCTCTSNVGCQGMGNLAGACNINPVTHLGTCTCSSSTNCGANGVCLDGICVGTVGGMNAVPKGVDSTLPTLVGCGMSNLTWTPGALPLAWSGSRYLVVVDGADHVGILGSPGLPIFASWVQSQSIFGP